MNPVRMLACDSDYYLRNKEKLLRDFDRIAFLVKEVLVSRYGAEAADSMATEGRRQFEDVIPRLPYIGGEANPFTGDLVNSSWLLVLYKSLRNRGESTDEIEGVGRKASQVHFASLSLAEKMALSGRWRLAFTPVGKALMRKQAALSQDRAYPGDFVFSYIEGDGEGFDFGLDFTECAVQKFFKAEGAGEFARYVCAHDFLISRATGSGLVRTGTLAAGAPKCDFRFKRGKGSRVRGNSPADIADSQGTPERLSF